MRRFGRSYFEEGLEGVAGRHPVSGRDLRVGVLINDRSALGLYLVHYLDARFCVTDVFCSRVDAGIGRIRRLAKWLVRNGVWRTLDQVIGKLYRKVVFGRDEARRLAELMDISVIRAPLPHRVRVHSVPSVTHDSMASAMRNADLDVLCVMCKEILPKELIALPRFGVIGQHPGITPHYRGSWSAFWAIANGEPHMVGTSVFVLDETVDEGAIIYQETVEIEYGKDNIYSLNAKAQMKSAELMARALQDLRAGRLTSRCVATDRAQTSYRVPGLSDFLRHASKLRELSRSRPSSVTGGDSNERVGSVHDGARKPAGARDRKPA
jgi:folate-dependent phosphoribosylglycinamide formyltransferase PurN